MPQDFILRGLDESNCLAVATCGHLDDYDPDLVESRRRYLETAAAKDGLEVIVAHDATTGGPGRPLGFIELVPIENAARDVDGQGVLFIHCLLVWAKGRGVGRALVEAAAGRAAGLGRGLAVDACAGVCGFMPYEYFLRLGFRVAQARGTRRLLYRTPTAPPDGERPRLGYLTPRYVFDPVPGKVVVDVFFTPLCGGLLSEEARAVRLAAERYPGRGPVDTAPQGSSWRRRERIQRSQRKAGEGLFRRRALSRPRPIRQPRGDADDRRSPHTRLRSAAADRQPLVRAGAGDRGGRPVRPVHRGTQRPGL